MNNNTYATLNLPNTTKAGNCIVIGTQQGASGTSFKFVDNSGNTYNLVSYKNDGANGQSAYLYIATNINAGANIIYASNVSGTTLNNATFDVTEWCNIAASAPVDKLSTNTVTSATILSASITPSVAKDLIYTYAVWDSGATEITNYIPNVGAKLLAADGYDEQVSEYLIDANTTATNQAIVCNASGSWIVLSVALKTASQGSPYSGSDTIVGIHHIAQTTQASAGLWSSLPFTNRNVFPSFGNLLVMMYQTGLSTDVITNVVDSSGNTWTHAAGCPANNTVPTVDCWFATNAIASSTNTVTFWLKDPNGNANILFYDVANASAYPYDTDALSSGNQGAAGNLATVAITPASSGGVILCQANWDNNTATNLTTQKMDANFYQTAAISGPCNYDQNNGWGHTNTVDASAQTFTWKFLSTSLAVARWQAFAISFK